MKVADLYKICTSSAEIDKSSCRFYLLGLFEGAGFEASTQKDESGNRVERKDKDKPYCVPDELPVSAMEFLVKMRMGEDLVMFPQDSELAAAGFVMAIIQIQYPCHKAK